MMFLAVCKPPSSSGCSSTLPWRCSGRARWARPRWRRRWRQTIQAPSCWTWNVSPIAQCSPGPNCSCPCAATGSLCWTDKCSTCRRCLRTCGPRSMPIGVPGPLSAAELRLRRAAAPDRRIAGGVDRQYGIAPLLAAEVEVDLNTQQALRLCGGYPLSYLAGSDEAVFQWRQGLHCQVGATCLDWVCACPPRRCVASGPCWHTCTASCSMHRNSAVRWAAPRTPPPVAISTRWSTR